MFKTHFQTGFKEEQNQGMCCLQEKDLKNKNMQKSKLFKKLKHSIRQIVTKINLV